MDGGNLHFYALCLVLFISILTYPEILMSSKRKEETQKDVALTGCEKSFHRTDIYKSLHLKLNFVWEI